jgi:hypothetical protein
VLVSAEKETNDSEKISPDAERRPLNVAGQITGSPGAGNLSEYECMQYMYQEKRRNDYDDNKR